MTDLQPDIRMVRNIAHQAERSIQQMEAQTDASQAETWAWSVLARHETELKQVDCCSRVFETTMLRLEV